MRAGACRPCRPCTKYLYIYLCTAYVRLTPLSLCHHPMNRHTTSETYGTPRLHTENARFLGSFPKLAQLFENEKQNLKRSTRSASKAPRHNWATNAASDSSDQQLEAMDEWIRHCIGLPMDIDAAYSLFAETQWFLYQGNEADALDLLLEKQIETIHVCTYAL